jgi:hypothetical protein
MNRWAAQYFSMGFYFFFHLQSQLFIIRWDKNNSVRSNFFSHLFASTTFALLFLEIGVRREHYVHSAESNQGIFFYIV